MCDRRLARPAPVPQTIQSFCALSFVANLQVVERDPRLPPAERACEPKEDRQEWEEHGREDEEHQQCKEGDEHDDRLDQKEVDQCRVRVLVGEL